MYCRYEEDVQTISEELHLPIFTGHPQTLTSSLWIVDKVSSNLYTVSDLSEKENRVTLSSIRES